MKMKKFFVSVIFIISLSFGACQKEVLQVETKSHHECEYMNGIPFGQKFCRDANLLPAVLKTLEVKAGDSVGK
jgi:thioredoxin-related protein